MSNFKILVIAGILFYGVIALIYLPLGEVFAAKNINIVNNLDVPLEFKEIKNRQCIKIKSSPPETVDAGEKGKFQVQLNSDNCTIKAKNGHLNIQYYVNNSSSGEQVGIKYKYKWLSDSGSCPKDTPEDIQEQVKNCDTWDTTDSWQYIYSPK